jgi:hypothetical protein
MDNIIVLDRLNFEANSQILELCLNVTKKTSLQRVGLTFPTLGP